MVELPWGCRRNKRGEVLFDEERIRLAATREKRRTRMYDLMEKHGESAAELLARVHKSRIREAMPTKAEERFEVGGKIAWRYVPPRIAKMYQRREIDIRQLKAASMFVYFYRLGWLLTAPGTNFPQSQKVRVIGFRPRSPWAGSSFPMHLIERRHMSVLEAGLVKELPFKELLEDAGGARITRHRTGRAALLSALSAFYRVLATVLTERE
jgi:hypothetical protein